jgi:hypothetical protein
MRSTSSTDTPFDVATACSLTACLSSALSCAPVEVGGTEDVVVSVGSSLAERRYRWDEDIVVGVMMYLDSLPESHCQFLYTTVVASGLHTCSLNTRVAQSVVLARQSHPDTEAQSSLKGNKLP